MPQVVEISLRLPSLRIRPNEFAEMTMVDNKDVRFTKRVELPSIPKPGDTLSCSIRFEVNGPLAVPPIK